MPKFAPRVPSGTCLESVQFHYASVMKAIKRLKPNLAAGPDGFPPLLFKNVGRSLAEPLSIMFSSFLSVHQIPSEWLKSIITPVYKNGNACDVTNYRPISLTCVACKLMERIISVQVLDYLRDNKLISKQQHGFLTRRSTVTNLLESVNDWSVTLNDKLGVVVACIDYAKAFDTAKHDKLIHKLSAYGIDGDLLLWVRAFLSQRSHCTRINQSYSRYLCIQTGVIQGSVLGPLLFLLFINDVTNIFGDNCTCKLYADDIKLYSVVDQYGRNDIQNQLDALQHWSDTWQLNISYKKCNILHLDNRKNKPNIKVTLGGETIEPASQVKDLGVIMDKELKFNKHISKIVSRAHRIANLIHKCFTSKDKEVLKLAFTTYVRPLLEYASSIWSPHTVILIKKSSLYRSGSQRDCGVAGKRAILTD